MSLSTVKISTPQALVAPVLLASPV